jgi:uroporphyrin-III C-methyltransferase
MKLPHRNTGKVFICGAGPGDPTLITVKAAELLRTCEVVLYDRLVSDEIINLIPSTCKKLCVGRTVGDAPTHQDVTNQLMIDYVRRGKKVLRLKGGDPCIFGRGGEEAEFLFKNNVEFEIIPGISSAIGSAEYAGIPLTHRQFSSALAIVTGHEDPEKIEPLVKWDKLASAVDTIVILMGVAAIEKISRRLIESGMNKNVEVAIVENGTVEKQRIIKGTLHNIVNKINDAKVKSPAVIIIGKVVSLQENLSWFKK